jgi:hypothetical protein
VKPTLSLQANRSRNKRAKPKPIMQWERLGLTNPSDILAPSIEEIRREVTLMASRGLAQGTRTRTTVKTPVNTVRSGANRQSRRGASE